MSYVVLFFKLVWGVLVGMFAAVKLPIVLPIAALLLILRWRKVGMLTWAIAWWFALYFPIKYGFDVPIPGSVVKLYMGIVTGSIFAYVTSSRERQAQFMQPIVRLVTEPQRRALLVVVVLMIPMVVAWRVYASIDVPVEAPAFGRTIHPAPPDEIKVHDEPVNLVTGSNPFRELEEHGASEFEAHVENGRRVYFQNCFYCHGDAMAGDGMFAHGLNPIPTNFTDPGVLPMLQESFLFWRISKGGPGMPEEGGPWDTAMPAWDAMLTTEEMWDAVLFLYRYTDFRPRAQHEVH